MPVGTARFADALTECLPGGAPGKLGVAISGGGDSTALLILAADWASTETTTIEAITIDHGLRPEAGVEAKQVAALCRSLSIRHEIAEWEGFDGQGNLQDAARRARQDLIAAWAQKRGISTVLLGHTQDDQAETVLMRLTRGSGVDGLSAMAPNRCDGDICWARPLLAFRRNELRAFLKARNVRWSDDPSNEDDRFDRIRIRKALVALDALGLTAEGLASTAARMQHARAALEQQTLEHARRLVTINAAGEVEIAAEGFAKAPEEIRMRLLAHSLGWIASADYRPRLKSLLSLLDGIASRDRSTLAGCLVSAAQKGVIRIGREANAVSAHSVPATEVWDGRWIAETAGERAGFHIAALGESGLKACPDWRQSGLSRVTLLASPAIWQENRLTSAPLAGWPEGWNLRLQKGADHYFTSILSH